MIKLLRKEQKQKHTGGISMRNLLNKKLNNEKGLTLIELLAVVVILAIIALIAIPSIGTIIDNTKSKAVLSDATQIIASAKTEIAGGGCTEKDDKSVVCSSEQLKGLVEGENIDLEGAQVQRTVDAAGKNVYKLTYAPLSDEEQVNEKYKEKLKMETDGSVTETNLAAAMGNAKEKSEE